MKNILMLSALLAVTLVAGAQIVDPVKFSTDLKTGSTAEG